MIYLLTQEEQEAIRNKAWKEAKEAAWKEASEVRRKNAFKLFSWLTGKGRTEDVKKAAPSLEEFGRLFSEMENESSDY